MKKVLVAAAGLMLAGTMATTAMADVTFQGDARARYYNQSDYNAFSGRSDTDNDFFNSRVRLQWKATTKGGAYAIGRFRLSDAKWDGTKVTKASGVSYSQDPATGLVSSSGSASSNNLRVDKAYIGVPFGPVTVEAGLMYRSVTDWFLLDVNVDALQFKYIADNMNIVAFYDVIDDDAVVADIDTDQFGVVLNQKFGGGWAMTAGAIYRDSDSDAEGFAGTLKATGDLGAVAVAGEISFVESDLQGTTDDGIGGWVSASMPLGAVSLTGMVGFTADGFTADGDFNGGFVLYGDYTQIASGDVFGSDGDTTFFSLAGSFKASEKLTLGASVGYADTDDLDGIFDIGATAAYAVTDGAALKAIVGYADIDEASDNPFGFGLSLEISY